MKIKYLFIVSLVFLVTACGDYIFSTDTPSPPIRPTTTTEANIELPAPQAAATSPELTPAQIFEYNADAVFTIYTSFDNHFFGSSGSGFFISNSGVAVTNHHVIEGWPYAYIRTNTGQTFDISGYYIYDDIGDVAIIQIAGRNFRYLTRGDSDALRIGEAVFAIGSPLGYHNTFSTGIISRFDDVAEFGNYRVYNMIQITAPISGGSSGGALFNDRGQVIGITTASYDAIWAQQLNFAIPISSVEPLTSAATELTPLPIGELLHVDSEDVVGNWTWGGGVYTFNADGTGDRVWDGIFDSFNWRVNGPMLVLNILDDENEQWVLSDISENHITVGGALFTRFTDLSDAAAILVGEWDWNAGFYQFNADGTGNRVWDGVAATLNWRVEGGDVIFDVHGSQQEIWTIVVNDENTVTIGGAPFRRATTVGHMLVGDWDWAAGWYTFFATGMGEREWDGEHAFFQWRVIDDILLIELPTGEYESWAVVTVNDNEVTIGGARFTRAG